MSDLISRKVLLDFLESAPFMIEHQNFKEIVIDWVKQQPMAYDLDSVVEQLEDYRMWKELLIYDLSYREREIVNKAIEIVKKGGTK